MVNIGQNKKVLMHWQYKLENNEFKKVIYIYKKIRIKNRAGYYFDDIIKL